MHLEGFDEVVAVEQAIAKVSPKNPAIEK